MITPLDIHNKEFRTSVFGGYEREEVDMFLDKLAEDYEKIFKENIELKDRINVLNEGIQHYKNMEETLQNTLVVAQNTAEDIKKNAYSKSDTIVKEAEMRASKAMDDATSEVIKIQREYDDLKKNYSIFKSRVESVINSHLELIRSSFDENNNIEEVHTLKASKIKEIKEMNELKEKIEIKDKNEINDDDREE